MEFKNAKKYYKKKEKHPSRRNKKPSLKNPYFEAGPLAAPPPLASAAPKGFSKEGPSFPAFTLGALAGALSTYSAEAATSVDFLTSLTSSF